MKNLQQILQEIRFGAQYLTDEERRFFDSVWQTFEKTGGAAEVQIPHVLSLHKKILLRMVDAGSLLAELEANVLMLSEEEQAAVTGAKIALEYGGAVDMRTLEKLLAIRKAFHARQHQTLVAKGEALASRGR